MTQEQALIAILTSQRNAALDGLAQISAIAETHRTRIEELERELKRSAKRAATDKGGGDHGDS